MVTLSTENRVILIMLYSLIMIFGVSGNSRVLYSLIVSKTNRKSIQNFYILALPFANNLYCLIYPAYVLPSLIGPRMRIEDVVFCRFMTFLSYTLAAAGLMAITALSLDRFIAIKYSFLHCRYKAA